MRDIHCKKGMIISSIYSDVCEVFLMSKKVTVNTLSLRPSRLYGITILLQANLSLSVL